MLKRNQSITFCQDATFGWSTTVIIEIKRWTPKRLLRRSHFKVLQQRAFILYQLFHQGHCLWSRSDHQAVSFESSLWCRPKHTLASSPRDYRKARCLTNMCWSSHCLWGRSYPGKYPSFSLARYVHHLHVYMIGMPVIYHTKAVLPVEENGKCRLLCDVELRKVNHWNTGGRNCSARRRKKTGSDEKCDSSTQSELETFVARQRCYTHVELSLRLTHEQYAGKKS